MSKWITDRRPTEEDALNGYIMIWSQCYREAWLIKVYDWHGAPWMPIPNPEPYVAPERYEVKSPESVGLVAPAGYLCVYDTFLGCKVTSWLPTREAAERIAAIYNEVMK